MVRIRFVGFLTSKNLGVKTPSHETSCSSPKHFYTVFDFVHNSRLWGRTPRECSKKGKLGQISAINPPKRLFREARSCFSASLTPKWGDMPYFFHILLRRRSNLRFWDFGTSVFFYVFPQNLTLLYWGVRGPKFSRRHPRG